MTDSTFKEDAKSDWLKLVKKHKNKRKGLPALSTLNTDAGNVEHNISMFNKMTSATEAPNNNPVSGPFGDSVSCSESLHKGKSDKDKMMELEYQSLPIEVVTKRGNRSGYYSSSFGNWLPDEDKVEDRTVDYTYYVGKDDLYSFIFEECIEEEDFPLAFDDNFDPNKDEDWAKFESWLDDNIETIYDKYKQKILDNWEEDAAEQASMNYDPDDYIDWDSMPGGHDDYRESLKEKLDDDFDMSLRTLL